MENNNRLNDFNVSKFYVYNGPNAYLTSKALVFNIYLDPDGPEVDYYRDTVLKVFPKLAERKPTTVIDLFAETLLATLKMDIDLFINKYNISEDGEDYIVAVEYLDDYIAEECVYTVSQWFKSMNNKENFDFVTEFVKLQAAFDKSLLGGPTIYSLVEAGLKRNIPVFYLFEENQFQWGYGRKQLRGRSTTFQTDGIKDTEFTMYKDMCADFLMMCGFPTPIGKNCYTEDEVVKEALKLGWPVVVKPVAGHKGQGVTTGIESEEEARKACKKIMNAVETEGAKFDGMICQQQIYGTDHRLLTVGGKFVAALQRIPAYVDGDGVNNIEKLIQIENDLEIRLDNARSPLCKIKIDQDLKDFLTLQGLTLQSIPKKGERIELRRVANISAGGVSINVTDKIHPKNIEMVESIAKFFKVKCLGIDVLAADIAKPWNEGNFGIIEINAGPGVFMHLAPAYGGSVDVPGVIMKSHFYKPDFARIPIVAGNRLTSNLAENLFDKLNKIKPGIEFGALVEEGVFFNKKYFYKNDSHDQNVKIILRNPELDFALFNHVKDDIYDFGYFHEGADIVIVENPEGEEKSLVDQVVKNGTLIEVNNGTIEIKVNGEVKSTKKYNNDQEKESLIVDFIESMASSLLSKYE